MKKYNKDYVRVLAKCPGQDYFECIYTSNEEICRIRVDIEYNVIGKKYIAPDGFGFLYAHQFKQDYSFIEEILTSSTSFYKPELIKMFCASNSQWIYQGQGIKMDPIRTLILLIIDK